MRIAILYYAVVPTVPIGRWHLHILKGLCHEHEFTVFSTRFENPCPDRIRWVRIPSPTRPAALVFVAFHILAPVCYWWHCIRRGVRFDLVQFVGSDLSFGDVSSAHFCNRAYLKHHWRQSRPHGLRRFFYWLDYRLHAIAEPWVYRGVRRIAVHSRGLEEEISTEYPFARSKIRFCPSVVDVCSMHRPTDFDWANFRARLGLVPGNVALAFVALGGFERKGLPLLLEGLARINDQRLRVIVVGGPPDVVSHYRSRAASLGLDGRVAFVGKQDDVRPYLWASDAFVFPSQYEAFPAACLEAAAAGLALIVPPLNGVEEFLVDGQNGFLVERSPEGLCRGFTRFLEMSPEDRQAMGRYAQECASQYSVEGFTDAWRLFYREFAEG